MENNAEDIFQGLFGAAASGTGEEELLRIASKFSVQLTSRQFRTLLLLQTLASWSDNAKTTKTLEDLQQKFLNYKQYHNSNMFVLKALEMISVRKLLNENSVKVNVQKQ